MNHPLNYDLIIFDLDGTIRQCIVHSTKEKPMPCHNHIGEHQIIPGTREILNKYDWTKVGIGLATNQAGIGLGYITEENVIIEINLTIRELFPEWPMVMVDDGSMGFGLHGMHHERRRFPLWGPVYRFAPAKPDASDARRKPSPYMILDLVHTHGERLDRTLYVGDSPEDKLSAERASVKFMWAWQFFGRSEQKPNIVKSHEVAK